jgi:predicted alpha/beta hydrolase family esterase
MWTLGLFVIFKNHENEKKKKKAGEMALVRRLIALAEDPTLVLGTGLGAFWLLRTLVLRGSDVSGLFALAPPPTNTERERERERESARQTQRQV